MEKEFISYELALRMKQLGFNENCYRVGNPNGAICWRFMDVAGVEGVGIDDILQVEFDERWVQIPTFSQVFRWFREKQDIEGFVHKSIEGNYYFVIKRLGNNESNIYEFTKTVPKNFNTYEEAELTCLEKLIEIVEFKLNKK
jgi:hypothetical protein